MNVIAYVLGMVLFIGGMVLFGYSWDGEVFHPLPFAAGLITVTLGCAVPMHLLKRLDR